MPLIILGASGRAAAQSARRAGLEPWVIDLFADRDLAAIAPVRAVRMADYPEGLELAASDAPDGPWIYTGALENSPDLIDRIARHRPLWGIAGRSLRGVRDPVAVAEVLRSRGLAFAESRVDAHGLPGDGSWLVKPIASAGGRRIMPLREQFSPPTWPVFFQKRVDGWSGAAIYIGHGDDADLVGLTRQWVGRPGADFAYMGSIGPWPIPDRKILERIGRTLAEGFGLVGLFGVDLVFDAAGKPYVVEVNPRYTASVEVLELGLGRSLLAEHARAFEPTLPLAPQWRERPPRFVAKWILFADRLCHVPRLDLVPLRAGGSFAVAPRADLPAIGSHFEAGWPIMTLLARGGTQEACQTRLARCVARWRSRVADDPTL